MKELKGLFYTSICLLLVKFLKFIECDTRTEVQDIRGMFFRFFDSLEMNGERVSYRQVRDELMNGNSICKKWAVVIDKLYDELY